MKRSNQRILTTHVGSLVRPPDLLEKLRPREIGQPYDQQGLAATVRRSVAEVVQKQVEVGIDVPSDGEYGMPNFSGYVNQRLSGFERRERNPNESPILNWGRDRRAFLEFYQEYDRATRNIEVDPVVCTGPISYTGQAAVQSDIETFKAALDGADVEEAFIPAVAPGTVEGQRKNEYYPTVEEYLFAIADAMHEEYQAIVDAGFLLQVDDPRVVTQYDMIDPAPSIEEFRRAAALRIEAVNRALGDIPPERVRITFAGGAGTGPIPQIFH